MNLAAAAAATAAAMFVAGHHHQYLLLPKTTANHPPPLHRQHLHLRRTTPRLPTPLFHGNLTPTATATSYSSLHCPCTTNNTTTSSSPNNSIECVGTGSDVECVVAGDGEAIVDGTKEADRRPAGLAGTAWEWALLVSPFFFWGTAMVAMKEVLPRVGPFFVPAFRLIPAGALLVGFAALTGRKQPSGALAWVSILLFAAVDGACFQGFLAEGLQKTSAGLGSVIIDSQPLTVAVLAALLFGESIGVVGVLGLLLGVVGLVLLEASSISLDTGSSPLWGSGEWWMFLAAQSMAVGTVMVRWVSKFSDPVMATGWHMIIGGLPLLAIAVFNHDPAFSGTFENFTFSDIFALVYTSFFGSAISYGVFFYNATRGSLTQLSSLTFLTPMFASIFGFAYLGETFTPIQLVGALVTIIAIYMVNYKVSATE